MGLYDEEVDLWLCNHSAIFTFFWGLGIAIGSLLLMPVEFYSWVKWKIKYWLIRG